MKKFLLFLLFFIFIFSCKNTMKEISFITDDLSLIEIANSFNSENSKIKVNAEFYKKQSPDDKNLIDYFKSIKSNNYDMLFCELNSSDYELDNYFTNIKKYSSMLSKKNNSNYDLIFKYAESNNNKAVIYTINFPVILIKNAGVKNTGNKTYMDFDDFIKFSTKANINENNGRMNKLRFGFTPVLSNLNEIDYFFIFNSEITYKNGKYSFLSDESMRAFDFIYNFDKKNNYGNEIRNKYAEKVKNIDKKYLLENNIISIDFMQLNKALCYPVGDYKIFLIKNMKYIGLNQRAGLILKQSKYKKESGIFIDYLLNEKSQRKIFRETLNKSYYYEYVNLPINKNAISDINESFINKEDLSNYIMDLEVNNFYNEKIKKSFFDNFHKIKDQLNKNTITENEFLKKISEELN